ATGARATPTAPGALTGLSSRRGVERAASVGRRWPRRRSGDVVPAEHLTHEPWCDARGEARSGTEIEIEAGVRAARRCAPDIWPAEAGGRVEGGPAGAPRALGHPCVIGPEAPGSRGAP